MLTKQEVIKVTINSLLSTEPVASQIETTILKKGIHMADRNGVEINVKNLTHRYTSKTPLTFDNVDMQAEPGESLVIIGRSGCGKSTLLHIIAGLLGGYNGTVQIDGKDVKEASSKWIMMFQAPHLFPWMTVEQNVGTGLRFAGWSKDRIRERVNEAI
ncbi:MAG: ATP-binding cassette domain-containing protein, partial [Gammaproteobacteria bacterium]|nr:ATP-binding cassette domain-containing protein [Gammaproteobacteria bacterium]